MTDDTERYRAIIIALEAECAAYRQVLAAIRDGVMVPRPHVPQEPVTSYYERYQQAREKFLGAQRDRAIRIRSTAGWPLRADHDAFPYMTAAEVILVATETLREDLAKPLDYEPESDAQS